MTLLMESVHLVLPRKPSNLVDVVDVQKNVMGHYVSPGGCCPTPGVPTSRPPPDSTHLCTPEGLLYCYRFVYGKAECRHCLQVSYSDVGMMRSLINLTQ